ncbi:HIT domain-containing protein [Porticoccaceae bacterium]|jgi:diadenosine tetraphosphate (Ap4A) HIT family hydrolase|nr:HIT domain-containing protein [Porticoccaceae bacterium]
MFQLHPVLQKDTVLIGEFSLSLVLISKDANYPWVILVPKRSEVKEIYQLSLADRQSLLEESCLLASALVKIFKPDKLNVATIGNMVPQLHMHHICRFQTDLCWPKPVWGQISPSAYANEALEVFKQRLQLELGSNILQ